MSVLFWKKLNIVTNQVYATLIDGLSPELVDTCLDTHLTKARLKETPEIVPLTARHPKDDAQNWQNFPAKMEWKHHRRALAHLELIPS